MNSMTSSTPETSTTPLGAVVLGSIAAIEQAKDLSEQTRRHWTCSLRQIAKWLNRPPAVIPARSQAVRISVAQLHHARVGVTPKTLANHKSNARAALRWFGKEYDVPQRGVRLTPAWARFHEGLDSRVWQRVSSLATLLLGPRHRPLRGQNEVFESYWRLPRRNDRLAIEQHRQALHGAGPGMPVRLQPEPPGLCSGSRSRPSRRPSPPGKLSRRACAAVSTNISTGSRSPTAALTANVFNRAVRERSRLGKAELVAMARMAVRLGVPIEILTSLTALLQPDIVERVVDAYWQRNGEEPKTFTIDLGKKVLRMARETGCLRPGRSRASRRHQGRAGTSSTRRFDEQKFAIDPASADRWHLERGRLSAQCSDAAGALGQGPRADQSCRLGAARCCHRDPHLRARSTCQSRQHRVGREPHQAGWAEHAVLAGIPALRCEEPNRSEFPVRSAPDGAH